LRVIEEDHFGLLSTRGRVTRNGPSNEAGSRVPTGLEQNRLSGTRERKKELCFDLVQVMQQIGKALKVFVRKN
jgi:hypothetical protein